MNYPWNSSKVLLTLKNVYFEIHAGSSPEFMSRSLPQGIHWQEQILDEIFLVLI